MELILALAILQEKNGDLKYEDIKIIAERNIFSPAKPKPPIKIDEKKPKVEPKVEEKKPPPAPYVTAFALYPDGFRMSVTDPNTQMTTRYKVGDKLIGGTIKSITNLEAIITVGEGEVKLRTGDAVKEGAAPTSAATGGPAAILAEAVPAEDDPGADETRKKMRDRFKKRPVDEDEDEPDPKKKKRP